MKRVLLATSLLLIGCGAESGLDVQGSAVNRTLAWSVMQATADVSKRDVETTLRGWSIHMQGNTMRACGDPNGCVDHVAREVRINAAQDECRVSAILSHEIGHVVYPNDPNHTARGWFDENLATSVVSRVVQICERGEL